MIGLRSPQKAMHPRSRVRGTVRERDGVEIELADGRTVVADAREPAGDVNVLSHAHGDHLFDADPADVVCSPLTARLAGVRRDVEPRAATHPDVELYDAGHIAGSTATLIDDGDARYLYTGDCSVRDRLYLDGFEPPSADVLILESTYGKPEYVFPPQEELESEIVDWLRDERRPVLLFGYSLGRAQKLQVLANRADRDRLFVTDSIAQLNEPISDAMGVEFDAELYGSDVELGPGDALVLPMQTNRLSFVDAIVDRTDAVKAGFSGWAVDDAFKYRGDYDETFVLSDHCDFTELLDVVRAVDPDAVYTQHGFADEFATHVVREIGCDARSLKRNQTSLADF